MFPCKQCDFTATSKAKLLQHKKTEHVKLVCLRCNDKTEEFPDKKKLNQHNIQVHQVGHLFKIPVSFFGNPYLLFFGNHYSIPHQEKINCSDCSFSTKHKTALQRHKVKKHSILIFGLFSSIT